MTQVLTVASPQEVAEEIARYAIQPNRANFSKVGDAYVYGEPLRASRRLSIGDTTYAAKDGGPVVRLNLPEQLIVLQLLSEKWGIPLRHGSMQENLSAAYSPDGQTYKKNVLDPRWVYTGEMVRKSADGSHEIGKAKGVELLPPIVPTVHAVFEGEDTQQTSGITVIRYKLGPVLQTEVPTKTGYFAQFKGVIPVDRELKRKKGRDGSGYWNGVHFDERNLSAVRCIWDSDGRGLIAVADWPLDGCLLCLDDFGVLGTWTDAL